MPLCVRIHCLSSFKEIEHILAAELDAAWPLSEEARLAAAHQQQKHMHVEANDLGGAPYGRHEQLCRLHARLKGVPEDLNDDEIRAA